MKLEHAEIIGIVRKTFTKFVKINNIRPEAYNAVKMLSNKHALTNIIKESFPFYDEMEETALLEEITQSAESLINRHVMLSDYEKQQLRDVTKECFDDVTKDI